MTFATGSGGDTGESSEEIERVREELLLRKERLINAYADVFDTENPLYNDKEIMKRIYNAYVEFNTDIIMKYARYGDDLAFSPKDIASVQIAYLIADTPLTKGAVEIMKHNEMKVGQLIRDGKNDEAISLARDLVRYANEVMETLESVQRDAVEVQEGGEFHEWFMAIYTVARFVIDQYNPDGSKRKKVEDGRPKGEVSKPKGEDGKPKVEDSKPKGEDGKPIRDELPYDTWRTDFIQPVIDEFRNLISRRLTSKSKQVPSRENIGKLLILATNIIIRSKQLEMSQLTKTSSSLQKINVEGKQYLYFIEAVVKAQTSAGLTDKEVINTMKLREFFEKVDTSLGLSGDSDESRLIGRFVEKLYG
jgi:hypothetical protein